MVTGSGDIECVKTGDEKRDHELATVQRSLRVLMKVHPLYAFSLQKIRQQSDNDPTER